MNVLQFLQDNGPWIAAAATLVMAIMVFLQTKESRRLGRENRRLAERSRIEELVSQVMMPLLHSAGIVSRDWEEIDHIDNFARIFLSSYLIFHKLEQGFEFNSTLYWHLKEMEPSLTRRTENYSSEVQEFWKSLLDLSNLNKAEESIEFADIPNTESVRAEMKENADNFKKKIGEIHTMLQQRADKYRKEYDLTDAEIRDSMWKVRKRGVRF